MNTPESTEPKTLAHWTFPLGGTMGTILIVGKELVADDFDALLEYVALFKAQYARRADMEIAARNKPDTEESP